MTISTKSSPSTSWKAPPDDRFVQPALLRQSQTHPADVMASRFEHWRGGRPTMNEEECSSPLGECELLLLRNMIMSNTSSSSNSTRPSPHAKRTRRGDITNGLLLGHAVSHVMRERPSSSCSNALRAESRCQRRTPEQISSSLERPMGMASEPCRWLAWSTRPQSD